MAIKINRAIKLFSKIGAMLHGIATGSYPATATVGKSVGYRGQTVVVAVCSPEPFRTGDNLFSEVADPVRHMTISPPGISPSTQGIPAGIL